jgi:ABC-type sugar transport system substrate-binding protein
MPKPPSILAAAAIVGALTLTACSSTRAHGAAAIKSTGVAPIGYSALFLQDPAQSSMVRVFQADAQAAGMSTLAPTSANNDAGQQDTDIHNLVAEGAKSLMVIPADVNAVVPPIKYALSKGIPVATLMLGPSGGKTSISLQVNNTQIGAQSCAYLGTKLNGRGTVLEILGDMRQTTAQDRHTGFTNCMKTTYPHITVITKTGGEWDPATATASAADVLNSTPHLGGIFMASDGYITGVGQAIRAAGHTAAAGKPGHVYTIAVDGTPTALTAIRNHTLDADNVQPVNLYVKYALQYLKLLHEGKTIPLGPTAYGSTVVMTKDGYPADVFKSTLVASSSVNSASLWANHAP